jgi:tetratricopeptide (TPR) repeat protein
MLRSMLVARAVLCALCASSALFAAPKASGADAKLRKQASALYEEGLKALDAGDAETCLAKFEEAYRTVPKPLVLLNIAECRKRTKDYAGAIEALERYLADRPDAPDRAAVEGRIADLQKTNGTVAVTSTPSGASIWVDGEDAARTTPADVSVAPGEREVALKLAGHETAKERVTVASGHKSQVDLTLPEAAPQPRAAKDEAEPTGTSDGGYHTSTGFWVAAGGAVAAAGVSAVFGVMALDKHSEFEDRPTRDVFDDGRRDALISDVALGVAAASAITAGVLYFTSKDAEKAADRGFSLGPSFSPRSAGLVGNVSF